MVNVKIATWQRCLDLNEFQIALLLGTVGGRGPVPVQYAEYSVLS